MPITGKAPRSRPRWCAECCCAGVRSARLAKHFGTANMDLTALIVFATALLVAAASPGPGIIAIVARVIGRGSRGAVAYSAGFVIGDLVWLTVAILGLAVVAQAFAQVFLVIKYAGAAYLL